MDVIDHLDKISKLGFDPFIIWNDSFTINYKASEIVSPPADYSVIILFCRYEPSSYSFVDLIEQCCDVFYSWYNKNLTYIIDYEKTPNVDCLIDLEEHALGDVTKMVQRTLNINSILDQ